MGVFFLPPPLPPSLSLPPSPSLSLLLQVEAKRAQPRHATPSGQAYAQMQQAQRSGSAYAAAAYQAYGSQSEW